VPRRRIALVSPFIDKRHGTERRVAELISRLAGEYEFHVYSNRVEDVDLDRIIWHRIPSLPAPHLFAYLWWFLANHIATLSVFGPSSFTAGSITASSRCSRAAFTVSPIFHSL
jgi:hypothetical protein